MYGWSNGISATGRNEPTIGCRGKLRFRKASGRDGKVSFPSAPRRLWAVEGTALTLAGASESQGLLHGFPLQPQPIHVCEHALDQFIGVVHRFTERRPLRVAD